MLHTATGRHYKLTIMKTNRFQNVEKVKMGKFNSICDLTKSNRQKMIAELNESDDFDLLN